jgi:moderate conductance mechanosensitive channel
VVYALYRQMNLSDFPLFSSDMVKNYLYVGITLLIAVLADNLLRALIKVPKHFDNRRARRFTIITKNIVTVVVYAISAYIILTILGVDLTPLLASASIIGIILGIGARSTIEDFITGLFLLSHDAVALGDYVKIGEAEGYVERIDSRTITIRAQDGSLHIIPNSQIKGLANFSRNKAHILIDLPLKSNQDINKTMKAAEHALELLQKDETFGDAVLPGSLVNGIESFQNPEIMTLRVTIVSPPMKRLDVGRKFRYLVKREFEKSKIAFA